MNKNKLIKYVLDNLALVDLELTKENLSSRRLIFLSGQRCALTNLLEEAEIW